MTPQTGTLHSSNSSLQNADNLGRELCLEDADSLVNGLTLLSRGRCKLLLQNVDTSPHSCCVLVLSATYGPNETERHRRCRLGPRHRPRADPLGVCHSCQLLNVSTNTDFIDRYEYLSPDKLVYCSSTHISDCAHRGSDLGYTAFFDSWDRFHLFAKSFAPTFFCRAMA